MSHNLVAYVYSSDSQMLEYINNQIQTIRISFPELSIEISNETDARLPLHTTKPDRFPAFMIFEHDVFKAVVHGKFDNPELFAWVENNLR